MCKLSNVLGFFLCTSFFFCGGSSGTKHAASYFPLRFEDLFYTSVKLWEHFLYLLSIWLDKRPVNWIRQFTTGNSQRSSTLCSEELNSTLRRWEWHYRNLTMARSSWTCPQVSTCPGTCHQMPKGKLRLFFEAAALAVLMPRLVVVPKTNHLINKINIWTPITLFAMLGCGGMTDTVRLTVCCPPWW